MPEHQEQQATVAGLDQPFNLAPGEVLPVAVVPAVFPLFCARSSFCRELPLSNTPGTRINRTGSFSGIDTIVHFVER
jgi:hypothetical protein